MGLQTDTGEEIYARTQREGGHLKVRKKVLTRNMMGWQLDLGPPSPQDQRIVLVPIYSILLWKSEQTQTAQKLQEEKYYIFKSCISCL